MMNTACQPMAAMRGDCNSRADDGAEEGAHEDGRAGLALFTGVEPAEGRCSQGREDRAFAHAEEQADGGEADLAFGKGRQSREDRPPEDGKGAGAAQAQLSASMPPGTCMRA